MFMNYRERFEYLKLSEGFDFVDYTNHKIELRCKECGYAWWKYDDFIRRSMHGKVVCVNCGLTCKYEAPNYEKRVPKPPYVKKGHHTQAVIEAREKRTAIQRQQGEELYRQKFEALELDFTFLKREWSRPHDNRFWIRCNKCGTEFLRDRAILNGALKSVHCKTCGNGTILHSAFVDEVMDFYSDKHSVKETAETFGISEWKVNEWVKRRGVTNGRTIGEINAENARKAAEKTLAEREKKAIETVNSLGFDYLGGYQRSDGFISVRCKTCGEETSRNFTAFRDGTAACKTCRRNKANARQEEEKKKRELEQAQKKALKKLLNPLGLSYYQLAREKKLDEAGVCIVCGREYKVRDYVRNTGAKNYTNPGYCSIECKNKNKNKRAHERRKELGLTHYARARKLGLPREKGITLPKVFERDGGICQLCFMPCLYYGDSLADLYPSIDHIIPLGNDPEKKGGHTWKNVQLAHRICNSHKRDYYGKEWNNAD